MPKVSIIVPIYNAAGTIQRCVDSILKQDFQDYELILVNDGSRDESPAILDQYALADSRIQVIHKDNAGVSTARNTALDVAKGEYIQFLDADDWITTDATKMMVRAMEDRDADLVVTDFYRVVGKHVARKGDIEEEDVMDLKTFADHMMSNPADFYYGVLWNKMYKRSIIEGNHLRMNPEVSWCEDFLFNMEYLLHCSRIYALQVPTYYYVKTEGSLVNQSGGLGIGRTVRMKLFVFDYYNNFYQKVYDTRDYKKKRPHIYAFLTDFAADGGAFGMAPGTTKLGQERITFEMNAQAADTILTNSYYQKTLLEKYLEPVAMANDLSVADLLVLFTVAAVNRNTSRRELASYADLSLVTTTASLQKLISRGYVKSEKANRKNSVEELQAVESEDTDTQGHMNLDITEEASELIMQLTHVVEDYRNACTAGFTSEERRQYLELSQKIGNNAKLALESLKPDVHPSNGISNAP